MARRPHGLIYGLLGLSLAVNLVGAGYLGYVGTRPKPPRTVENTINFVSERYPKAVGAEIRKKLEERRPELRRALDDMKDARRATRDAMGDTPLDKARVDAAFAEARAKAADFQKVIHGAIADAMPDLSDTERAKIDRNEAD